MYKIKYYIYKIMDYTTNQLHCKTLYVILTYNFSLHWWNITERIIQWICCIFCSFVIV